MTTYDLATNPVVAVWETTHADHPHAPFLAGSSYDWEPRELSATEAEKLIRDVADLRAPVFVFAGANPLARPEIASLVQYACSCGLRPSIVLKDSRLLTREIIENLKSSGLSRCGLALHGASVEVHENISCVHGSFRRTLQAMKWVNECRVQLQVHTELSRGNFRDLEHIAALLKGLRVLVWSLVFPAHGREAAAQDFTAEEYEAIFERIYAIAQNVDFKIKPVEADHYRRYVTQKRTLFRIDKTGALPVPFGEHGIPGVLPINDARGTIFIGSTGEVYPSAQIGESAGNVRTARLKDLYRDSQLFRALRDPALLKGKCGDCEYKQMCGGSRARAWIETGDMFAEDEACAYQPATTRAYKAG
ncbi:MAG TPA: radical SAM protein [Terriglobales bacterium]|nr:radical SAM protein [Terriglobales bacterium]